MALEAEQGFVPGALRLFWLDGSCNLVGSAADSVLGLVEGRLLAVWGDGVRNLVDVSGLLSETPENEP